MRILINTQDINAMGGVATFYKTLLHHLHNEIRIFNSSGILKKGGSLLSVCKVYFEFIYTVMSYRPDIIQMNPSLDKRSVIRDAIYILLSKLMRKKVVIFWHGWRKPCEQSITQKWSVLFSIIYNKADLMFVLASDFEKTLRKWKISTKIVRETTHVANELLAGYDNRRDDNNRTVLFMSRVQKDKGIYRVIEIHLALQQLNPEYKLIIAGDGDHLQEVKSYINKNQIPNVIFSGYVRGQEKSILLKRSGLFILASESEGMPIAVLEAMAFGLPVVTTLVGGLNDLFIDGKMGIVLTDDTSRIVTSIEELLANKDKYRQISDYNFRYAKEHFYSSCMATRLEEHYKELMKN